MLFYLTLILGFQNVLNISPYSVVDCTFKKQQQKKDFCRKSLLGYELNSIGICASFYSFYHVKYV